MKNHLILVAIFVTVYAQFSAKGQKSIVDFHNKIRSSIAKGTYVAKGTKKSPGSNIMKMKWNATIAKTAQNYANKCPSGHSYTRGFGENMWSRWSYNAPKDMDSFGLSASGAWANEFEKYGWKSNKFDSALFRSGVGHATQIAWASTSEIGCGIKNCGKDKKNMYTVLVVCQYKAQGNMMGGEVYKSGKTFSECPLKTKCEKSTGLCI